MSGTPLLVVQRRKIANVLAGEPWVFPNAVLDGPAECALVEVRSEHGDHIGWADYNPLAPVRARILSRSTEWPGEERFLSARLQGALWRRIGLGLQPQGNALRLLNGEGDGVPGLVVDSFGAQLVIDLYSAGMRERLPLIQEALRQFLPDQKQHVRMGEDAARREGVDPIEPEAAQISFAESGVLFTLELSSTQKTGFYLDQRDNRRLVGRIARDRRVLDLFCYHGGFSLTALAAGAQSAIAIDSSASALAAVQANAQRNGLEIETREADVFSALPELIEAGERFDLIICDPPKLAPRKSDKGKALSAYRFLIDRCLNLLGPTGVLLVSSCSQAISEEDLRKLLAQQAAKHGRELDVIAQTAQPFDHPWPIGFSAGRYLSTIVVHLRPLPPGV